jgi:hypothetical protein
MISARQATAEAEKVNGRTSVRPFGASAKPDAVIGFAALGAVVLYFATVGLLYLRSNFCDGSGSSMWCRDANIAKLPDLLKDKNQSAHK